MIWKVLGIEQTKDEKQIRTAYHNKLRLVNPEDDEEGFKELRRAYEEALEYANQEESEDLHNIDDEGQPAGRKNEVDLWIDRIDAVYQDVRTRRDEKCWDTLLHDPVCDDLDTELEAGEKLLVYLMSHSYMPQQVWKLVDKRFGYMESFDQLKERFPENFLEYIKWQIKTQGFIDYDLFDGKTDSHVDDYINKLFEIKSVSEEKDLKKLRQLLNELSRFEVTHPFGQVEEARYLLLKQSQEGGDYKKEALSIMEELDFEYSQNPYVERIYAETLLENGEIERAKAVYDTVLEESPDNYGAMLGQANCIFLLGDAETAKEQIEDVLEERVQDTESLELLDRVNDKLVKDYEAKIKEAPDQETCFKLGWCYYQQKKFQEGIDLLDRLVEGKDEDYDYINLRCRLYLASEDYDKAYPLARKWVTLIEESVDDGSKEMQKRKNRLSLAHFSVGVCIWEEEYKKAHPDQKKESFTEAVSFIKKAISEENNELVMLSYMEQLARLFLEDKQYEECITICDEIIEKDSGFFPAYVHRQKANYELRNAKEVIDDYFTCIEIYAGYAPPYVLAAEVFFAFDQYDDVESVLEAAKTEGVESDALELYRIRCLHYKQFSEDNVRTALKAIEELRDKVKADAEGSDIEELTELEKEYAILCWDLDKTDKALDIIENCLKVYPDHPTMLHLKIDILNRENQCEEALKVCMRLVRLEPDDLYAKSRLGGCYERLDELKKAIQCYEEILTVNPEYVPALRRLMYIHSYLSNREDDRDICERGIHYATRLIKATGSSEGYVERGNLYIDLYELEKAVADCEKAIELDPEAYYAYNNLGCALLKLRRVDEAVVPLKKVIAMEPDKDHLPYMNLAECYALKKEYDKAIEAYREILRIRPKAVHIKKEIAKIYVLKKEYDKAVNIYQNQINEIQKHISGMKVSGRMQFYAGKDMTEDKENLLNLYLELADTYREANDLKHAEQYYKKAEFGPAPFFQYCSCSVMDKLAEYYRNKGDLKKAERIVCKALCIKDEKVRRSRKFANLYFTYATILFEKGNQKKKAAEYALRFIRDLVERKGGLDALLADGRYRQMYLYDLAIMNICAGELKKARGYLDEMRKCKLCVTCESWDCFEYYFGMGLLAELAGDKKEAKRFYEKAIEIKGSYPCAQLHLKRL